MSLERIKKLEFAAATDTLISELLKYETLPFYLAYIPLGDWENHVEYKLEADQINLSVNAHGTLHYQPKGIPTSLEAAASGRHPVTLHTKFSRGPNKVNYVYSRNTLLKTAINIYVEYCVGRQDKFIAVIDLLPAYLILNKDATLYYPHIEGGYGEVTYCRVNQGFVVKKPGAINGKALSSKDSLLLFDHKIMTYSTYNQKTGLKMKEYYLVKPN